MYRKKEHRVRLKKKGGRGRVRRGGGGSDHSMPLLYTLQSALSGPSVEASASGAEDPGFESRLRRDFFRVESYQWLKNWHSSGYPVRRLALKSQHMDWSTRCQYTVTG